MTSTRAEDVAEVLWELKRADKVASMTAIATRAGFSAGSNGRAIKTALKAVRRDWPHLQWWRAVGEAGMLDDTEQGNLLVDAGFEVAAGEEEGEQVLTSFEELRMVWEEEAAAIAAEDAAAKGEAPEDAKEPDATSEEEEEEEE